MESEKELKNTRKFAAMSLKALCVAVSGVIVSILHLPYFWVMGLFKGLEVLRLCKVSLAFSD